MSDDKHMFGRTSLSLLGALPLAVVALAGCSGNASRTFHALGSDDINPHFSP